MRRIIHRIKQNVRHPDPFHHRNFWWILIPVMVLLAAVYGLFFLHNPTYDKNNPNAPKEALLIVPEGASMKQIADSLAAKGFLRSEITFRAAAKLIRAGHGVHGGTFKFERGLDNLQMLQRLIGDQYQIVYGLDILEGFRMKDVATQVASNLNLNAADFIAAASDKPFIQSLGVPAEAPNAEGYLYPDKYKWLYPLTARQVVQQMITHFHQMVPDTLLRANAEGLTPYKIMIFASITEGETKVDTEKYIVAGVYENRYRIGMKLQADPTVQYGAKLDRAITHSDIMRNTAYNTYLNTGLPPGPINNPSVQTIRAAVHPRHHDYLFFVAKRDGSHTHYFSSTYADQILNIKREERNIAGNVGGH